jgi:hypothetical protein
MKSLSRLLSALWIVVSGLMAGGVAPAYALNGNSLFEVSALSHVSRDHYDAEGIGWARDHIEKASLIGPRRALLGGSKLKPALSLPFSTMSTGADLLAKGVTYTSSGLGTQYDSTGKLTWKPNNLLTWSNDFTNAAWTKDTSGSITATGVADPLGGTLASTFTAGAAGSRLFAQGSVVNGNAINSIWMRRRAGTGAITLNNPTGTVGQDITSQVSTSWARVYTKGLSATAYFIISLATSGDAVDVAFAQQEAVTYQTTPRPYVATTSAAYYGPRFDFDPVTLAAKGLLIEESRTNIATGSADLSGAEWTSANLTSTANSGVGPTGATDLPKFIASNTNNVHARYASYTVTASQPYTISTYVRAAGYNFVALSINNGLITAGNEAVQVFNLSAGTKGNTYNVAPNGATITPVGNGLYRISITHTWATTTIQVGVWPLDIDRDIHVGWLADGTSGVQGGYAQLELGSFATSYTPTGASSVTRAPETASITGAAFSAFFNASAGTLLAEYDFIAGLTNNKVAAFNPVNIGSYAALSAAGSGDTGWYNSGVTLATASGGTSHKKVLAYGAAGDFAASLDGGAAAFSSASDYTGTSTSLQIGQQGGGGQCINGHIKSITYWRTRLPNAQLQGLTQTAMLDLPANDNRAPWLALPKYAANDNGRRFKLAGGF